ncbi:5-methylcytosine-specific restriction enzyme MrcB-like protein/dynein-related subfamily AAA family protein [Staphylococcus auricularis]|uniref:DUF3578 domain-containing protein n=1 Tax=Staphylococcus auricularis TaxID=29379 RepID=A0AAP8PN57_9STAP|nr:DUF3578 domain-containing protein [Staphylococcus auricularis]MBM0868313.1 DUF3578 domain-containing protein [Staphylococcus auricularis]PNZ66721.1 DUF3578 domain-containing protein [Staphylococcus auricularis]QPT06179.1 DUF3578 domain-containing protein [Staphylococcus auricularis]SQJ05964.1 endonuclease [Staphylococcus auricularis]BCU51276.1 hypothetical protein JCM2421_00480 [Staphylococcus auricularis]
MSLSTTIKEIENTYFKEKETGLFKGTPVGELVRHKIVEELQSIEEIKDYKIKGSIGNISFATIPWVAIMNEEITTSTSKGIFIIFLFSSDEKRVYLTLNQGADNFKGKRLKDEEKVKISQSIYGTLDSPKSKPININLNSNKKLPKNYEITVISGYEYHIDQMPDTSTIENDISNLVDDYEQLTAKYKQLGNNLDQFYEYCIGDDLTEENSAQFNNNMNVEEGTENAGYIYDNDMGGENEIDPFLESEIVRTLTEKLINSKNIILRGAPGTGKSYLAKAIASNIIGVSKKNLESSERFEFVQFHPNYDYTDFVEGIRPVIGANDTMGFKLEPGIFKVFCEKAKNAQNDNGAESGRNADQKFVFVIDEINRGEISKIFGELFFSIDPSYRGITGAVKTQYANMKPGNGKFYIPDNVYIIGTMNDIDRSVDTFDFAMRRRFRFIEIKANENTDMLDALGNNKDEAIQRMTQLNNAISQVEDLNSHYHIGASYFLKLKDINYEALWEDYLEPLLADYVKGMFNEEEMMESFKLAYNHSALELGSEDEID